MKDIPPVQKPCCVFWINYALSKLPHFHRAYLVTLRNQMLIAVGSSVVLLKLDRHALKSQYVIINLVYMFNPSKCGESSNPGQGLSTFLHFFTNFLNLRGKYLVLVKFSKDWLYTHKSKGSKAPLGMELDPAPSHPWEVWQCKLHFYLVNFTELEVKGLNLKLS